MRAGSIAQLLLLGVAVAVFLAPHANASTAATMTIDSTSQSVSAGSKGSKVNKQPKGVVPENRIELLSVTRPGSDATSSVASGAVRKTSSTGSSSSLIVTKAYDESSAQLEQAEATNEFMRQVTIAFAPSATANGKGSVTGSPNKNAKKAQTNYKDPEDQTSKTAKTAQVLVLKNAQITLIQQTRNIQQITIEYQSIEVTYASGKTAAADDWETP